MIMKVSINKKECKGCGLCRDFCPKKIIELSTERNEKGYSFAQMIDNDACISCAFCATMCPDCLIEVRK